MWIITSRQDTFIQKVIDYILLKNPQSLVVEPEHASDIRKQIGDDNFKKHLTQGMEFGETFEPLNIDVANVYKFYNRLHGESLPLQKKEITKQIIKLICGNLKIRIPDKEILNYNLFSGYIVNETLKLDDQELVSCNLIKNYPYSLALSEILDLIKLLEFLARGKVDQINKLLTGWDLDIAEIKNEFAKDIALLQKEFN
jgi:hypothetical protein